MLAVLQAAEDNLRAARCEEYYGRQMSPNFRRTTAPKALRALVSACQSRPEIRERLLGAFRLARNVTPRFEYAGTRAIYDLRGQGLPFDTLQAGERVSSLSALQRMKDVYAEGGFDIRVIEARPPLNKAKRGLEGRDEAACRARRPER